MRIILAGGGTGGHVFPALAIAGEMRSREPDAQVLFVGTRRGFEATLVPKQGYPIEFIEVHALKGVGVKARLRSLVALPRALWQSLGILRRFRPDVVLGVGGYASGPVVLAARLLGVPAVLAEPNAVPGFTNRLLGRFAHVVCVAFEQATHHFSPAKVRLTGNPIRLGFDGASYAPRRLSERPCVFVCGGSQGAHALNDLAAGALIPIARAENVLRIIHQTGENDLEPIRARYAQAGVEAEVHAFVDDMASHYAAADLVISRAGATTIAELTAAGRPAILVPYPHAADDHQWHNARELRDAGAAVVIRQDALDETVLADVVRSLLHDADRRVEMARAMRRSARLDAATRIVDECARLAGAKLAVGSSMP